MPYYHELVTEKSWQLLRELRRRHRFILIGGWAVYLYTKALKSKDIDIICNYEELDKFKAHYSMTKNDRLKKYEIKVEEIDIDIYVPFFSDLGVPVEMIEPRAQSLDGFHVPEREVLLLLKLKAWQDRGHSLKGEKDKIDIIALLRSGVDFKKFKILIDSFRLEGYRDALVTLLEETMEVTELDLNVHQFSRWKKKILTQF